MTIDVLTAAKAYRNQMTLMEGQQDTASSEGTEQSPFAKLLENTLGNAVNAGTTSEALQTQSLTTGKVDLASLVTAVANAELSLNTIVAIRDRVIGAYNDIIKMSI